MKFHDVLPELSGSRAKAKILEKLLQQPAKEWTGNELAKRAGVSSPQAQHVLRALERHDLAFSRPVGKSRIWTLNRKHVFVPHLQAMLDIRTNFQTAFLEALRTELSRARFLEIRELTLFGSVARGDDQSDSDADIFIRVSDPHAVEEVRQASLAVSVQLMDQFGKVAMPLVLSEKEMSSSNPRLLENIRREGITFFEGLNHA